MPIRILDLHRGLNKVYCFLIHLLIFRLIKYIDPLFNKLSFSKHFLNFRQFEDTICNPKLILPSKASMYSYIICYAKLCYINMSYVLGQ